MYVQGREKMLRNIILDRVKHQTESAKNEYKLI